MKKSFLLLLVITFALSVNAESRKSILRESYTIISDDFSKDVPVGKCYVVGRITDPGVRDGKGENVPIVGAEVSTLDRKKTSFTDENGIYKLILDATDTSIFMYVLNHEEIVIWNYNFQSQHIVSINFSPVFDNGMMDVDKPVIYLYSENEINAEIKFSCKGDLTFTYPTYYDSWNVVVKGNKISQAGKTYPYLFWEAKTNELTYDREASRENQTMNGFLIKTDSVVDFLENSLIALGLNSTEQTDFITFWAPRMISEPYALVQFFVDDLYQEKISEMTITPTPDAMRRVFMMFTPLENDDINLTVLPQELTSFQRKGFTVLEWGGSEATITSLMP